MTAHECGLDKLKLSRRSQCNTYLGRSLPLGPVGGLQDVHVPPEDRECHLMCTHDSSFFTGLPGELGGSVDDSSRVRTGLAQVLEEVTM